MHPHSFQNKLFAFRRWSPRLQWLLLSCAFSLALAAARVLYTGQLMFLFLVWNLFLGWLPYYLSSVLINKLQWIEDTKKFVPLFICWLLLLPNSFYIITDLFHLEERQPVPLWFDLALIFSFAWNGLLMGALSIRQMEKIVAAKWNLSSPFLFLAPLSFLCGLGVYIGRYLRYNSWDVFTSPFAVVQDVLYLAQHPLRSKFEWSMIICYGTLLLLMYMCGRSFTKEEA